MDPDETLRWLRETFADGVEWDAETLDAVAERFRALDGWLSKGGFLPTAWRASVGERVLREQARRIAAREPD